MSNSGYVENGATRLYFEQAGSGTDLVLLHAGVADHRQWNEAFAHFRRSHRVLRYDQRGFGRSEHSPGSYRAVDDLEALLADRGIRTPAVMIGCSMGGTLALDFALAHPERVRALVLVCSGPSGLKLDVPRPEIFAQVEAAEARGDFEQVCELETHAWFDGLSRRAADVDAQARALLYDMNRRSLEQYRAAPLERQFDLTPAAYKRLGELQVPVLIITGELDLPYTHAAADYMYARVARARRVEIKDAAHLPNMEHPGQFNRIVEDFLTSLGAP